MIGLIIALTTVINTRVAYSYYIEHFLELISPGRVTAGDSLHVTFITGKVKYLQGDYEKALYNFYIVTQNKNEFADSALFFISLIQDKLGLYNESMDSRKYFIQKFPDSPLITAVSFLYALNLRNLTGDYKGAMKYLKIALEGENAEILPYIYLETGVTGFMMKDYATALEYFNRTKRFPLEEPLHSYFTCFYGFTLFEAGKFKEALNTLTYCHRPELENYRDYYMARSFIQLGHPDSAESILGRLVLKRDVEPEILGSSYYFLGEINFINGDYRKSMEYYKLALRNPSPEIDPDRLRYKIELCKYRLGLYRSATELNISFVKKYPDSPLAPELLYEVFFLYTVRHWEKSALNILKWLAVRYDGNAYTIQAISEGLKRGLSPEKIYRIVARRIKKAYLEKNPPALLVLAVLYDSLGMADSALEMYSKLINSSNPEIKYRAMMNSMKVYMKIKRYNEAILVGHQLFNITESEDTKFSVLKKLIEAYTRSGQTPDLEKFLLSVIEQFTGDHKASIYIHLADLREESGDSFMAKFYLKRAFEAARDPELKKKISLRISRMH